MGIGLDPVPPPVKILPSPLSIPPESITIGPETITMIATCSVGIHLSVCWVVDVSWDGSWEFSRSITTPQLTVKI
jgi:hypothetical protein